MIHYLLNSLVGLLWEICWRLLGIIGVVWSTLSESVIRSTIIVTGSVASKVVLRTWSWSNLERALSSTYEWRRILNIRFVLERFRYCERSAAATPLKFHLYSIILSLWWNLLFNLVFDLLSLELLLSQYVLISLHDTLKLLLILLLMINIREVLDPRSTSIPTTRPDIGIGSSVRIELITSWMLVITKVESLLLETAYTIETWVSRHSTQLRRGWLVCCTCWLYSLLMVLSYYN